VVASAGVPELVIVDQTGRVSRRFGNEGQGPGEFLTITSVHVTEAGTVIAFDDRQGRLTEFDSTGSLLATRSLEASPLASLIPLVASMTGPSLAVYIDNRSLRHLGSLGRDTTPLLRYAAGSSRPDTVSKWPTKVWSFRDVGIGVMRTQVTFSPDLLASGQADRIALADTHAPLVTVLDEAGNMLMRVRWAETPRPVTNADLKAWKDSRAAQLPDDLPDNFRRARLDAPHHHVHPLLVAIALDREGGLWIAPTSLRFRNEQTWIVLDRRGAPQGAVRLPVSSRIMDARRGRLSVLDRDDLDVEVITVFAVDGSGVAGAPDAS